LFPNPLNQCPYYILRNLFLYFKWNHHFFYFFFYTRGNRRCQFPTVLGGRILPGNKLVGNWHRLFPGISLFVELTLLINNVNNQM
jgi:hypothetical protein